MPDPQRVPTALVTRLVVLVISITTGTVSAAADKPPAAFSDYAPALQLIADDINVANSESPLLIVWLLDESLSMVDDRGVISKSLEQFQNRLTSDATSAVVGFGKSVNVTTPKPTDNVEELRKAFQRVRPNKSGEENYCRAIAQCVTEFGKIAQKQKHKLFVIVATDESPSDAGDFDTEPNSGLLEEAIAVCKRNDARVFTLGREAVFGAPHSRLRWTDPVYKLKHWIPVNQGPDAAGPERLLWNGLQSIHPTTYSGFGSYSQSRLCCQTGGRFIILEEFPRRVPYAKTLEAMRGYEPELVSRSEYEAEVAMSPLRTACRQIIAMLDPKVDKKLMLPTSFKNDVDSIRKSSLEASRNAAHIRDRLETSIALLRSLQNQRDAATSKRTQANFDLLLADCLTARVRLTEYLLALDSFAVNPPDVTNEKHNRWNTISTRRYQTPADPQARRMTKAYGLDSDPDEFRALLNSERDEMQSAIRQVSQAHPNTPWAVEASNPSLRSAGIELRSSFLDPRYQEIGKRIRPPTL